MHTQSCCFVRSNYNNNNNNMEGRDLKLHEQSMLFFFKNGVNTLFLVFVIFFFMFFNVFYI
jgi:hypothetical protein